ncbi:MAG TPA: zinc-ribbon domain-containing protein [Candidatus Limnocylindria bacterium]|nr:zinc-ribbon domain-containing protein [Candidatus Limnocylindria bacterium]
MDNDERDRRDWPEANEAAVPPEEPVTDSGTQPPEVEAVPSEPAPEFEAPRPADPGDEPMPSAAEIESWPSQDVPRSSSEPEGAWPTEPPAAGSSTGWPTEAPERGAVPTTPPSEPAFEAVEPSEPTGEPWAATSGDAGEPEEQAPSEIEAYPAAPAEEAAAMGAGAAAGATAAHAVPEAEGAIGESTQCPRCGTENRPGLSFCRNCGQRLVAAGTASTMERPGTPEGTQACPRCGTHNRAGVAFCQNCGANLRGTAPGYVPPAAAAPEAVAVETTRRGAVLGPVVLLIGLVGIVTGYLLPFAFGSDSLFERAFAGDGYGVAFWSAYDTVGTGLAEQAYFGLAAAVPLLALLLLVLAIAGFVRAAPGPLQTIGLVIALLWSVGFIVLFLVLEVAGNWGGDLIGLLRDLSPAGIIFFLASLIVLIGTLTRFARS